VNLSLPILVRFDYQSLSKENKYFKLYLFLYYFYVLCHNYFINFTLQRYTLSSNHTFMQLFDGEYQVPIATPYDVAAVDGEGAELFGV